MRMGGNLEMEDLPSEVNDASSFFIRKGIIEGYEYNKLTNAIEIAHL